jgi:hypothetical protein
MRKVVENRQDRLALAEDAGWGRISVTSVAAGILVGYGAFAILAGLTAAVLGALDVNVDLTGADLRRTGTVGGIVLGAVLFLSWYFGAYTAGRMARRAGLTHGVVVFFIGVLLAVAVAAVVEALGATGDVVAGLERLGVPTTAEQWSDIGTVAGIASLVGMLAGCLLGGAAGERWHAKLMARALDPGVGPEGYALAAEKRALPARERRRRRQVDLTRETAPAVNEVDLTREKAPAVKIDALGGPTTPADGDPRAASNERIKIAAGRRRSSAGRNPQPTPPVEQTAASKARSEEKSTAS